MAESSMISQKAVEITVSMEISTREIQGAELMCKSMREVFSSSMAGFQGCC